jgi:cell division protein FtsB
VYQFCTSAKRGKHIISSFPDYKVSYEQLLETNEQLLAENKILKQQIEQLQVQLLQL